MTCSGRSLTAPDMEMCQNCNRADIETFEVKWALSKLVSGIVYYLIFCSEMYALDIHLHGK